MRHLQKLTAQAKDGEILNLQALKTFAPEIFIGGKIERTSVPQFSMSLQLCNSIRSLILNQARLDENSFSHLQEIHCLTFLGLSWAYDGSEMCFLEKSFLSLQVFGLVGALNLRRIEITKGAMPNLSTLVIANCPGLKELPLGIQHLTKLEFFDWRNPDSTLVESVQRERSENQLSEDGKRILDVVRFYSAEEWPYSPIY